MSISKGILSRNAQICICSYIRHECLRGYSEPSSLHKLRRELDVFTFSVQSSAILNSYLAKVLVRRGASAQTC